MHVTTITRLSKFKVVNLSHKYVLSYVNITKYLPDTYYKECLIMVKVQFQTKYLAMHNIIDIINIDYDSMYVYIYVQKYSGNDH